MPDAQSGYLIIYREAAGPKLGRLKTFLPPQRQISIEPVIGPFEQEEVVPDDHGNISVSLPQPNNFAILHYRLLPK